MTLDTPDVTSEHRTGAAPAKGMVWIPQGEFLMGSEDFYPEERPVHRVSVEGSGSTSTSHGGRRALRQGDGLRQRRRAATRPFRLSRRRSRPAGAGLARLPQDLRPRAVERRAELVGVRAGGVLEEAGRAGRRSTASTATRSSRWPGGRGGLRVLGRQGVADRGRVGVRRPRRTRRSRVRLGSRALPGRKADGKHLAERVSVAEPECGRLRAPRLSAPFRRTALGSTTCAATSGSGRATGSPRP